jgi:SpoVK/Ycf46/Vps4 family AAA+-type ATPase
MTYAEKLATLENKNKKKKIMNTSDLKSFHYLENGEIGFSILDTVKTQQKLDAGVYSISYLGYPESRVLLKTSTDKEIVKMHNFSDKEKLENLFKVFFNKSIVKKMKTLGFYHKVGIMLYGKEGTGKSTIIKNYINKIVKDHNGIVFYFTGVDGLTSCWEFIKKIRAIQDNPIVVVFEEMDMYVVNNNEGYLKTIFDGNNAIDNLVIFGSTNYIERIPDAIKNRPSRFKYVLNIEGIQSEEEIYVILENMIGDLFSEEELKEFSFTLKGKSLDFIKQFGVDKIMSLETYSHNKKKSIGFTV